MKKIWVGLVVVLLLFLPKQVQAGQEQNEEEWIGKIKDEIDLDQLDDFTVDEFPAKMKFSDLVDMLWEDGADGFDGKMIAEWIFDLFFYECSVAKEVFFQMIGMIAVFSVLKQIMEAKQSYLSEVSSLMVYVTMMGLLMRSFLLMADIAGEGINRMMQYLAVLVPAYATALAVSGGATTAAVYYEFSFMVMTIFSWAMKALFVPGINIYLIFCFLNQMFEEERLSKLADLLEGLIQKLARLGITTVVGISCVQSLLNPAKDRLSESVVFRSASAIPGLGGLIGSAGDVLLSCGVLIKNSVGVAGMIILFVICLVPMVKIVLFVLLYKVLSAVMQPMADKRLVEGIHCTAKAANLYLVLVKDSMMMFFLSLAMVTASTSFLTI